MTETELLRQIVQKQEDRYTLLSRFIVIPRVLRGVLKKRDEEITELLQQLDKAQGKPLMHDEAQELESKMGF